MRRIYSLIIWEGKVDLVVFSLFYFEAGLPIAQGCPGTLSPPPFISGVQRFQHSMVCHHAWPGSGDLKKANSI
jgi:hypothetical protein